MIKQIVVFIFPFNFHFYVIVNVIMKAILQSKQLPRWTMKYSKCLSYPLPLYAAQKISPFLNSRIYANHDKVA